MLELNVGKSCTCILKQHYICTLSKQLICCSLLEDLLIGNTFSVMDGAVNIVHPAKLPCLYGVTVSRSTGNGSTVCICVFLLSYLILSFLSHPLSTIQLQAVMSFLSVTACCFFCSFCLQSDTYYLSFFLSKLLLSPVLSLISFFSTFFPSYLLHSTLPTLFLSTFNF